MNGTAAVPPPSYRDLLSTAYAWGRADGLLAADFEPLAGDRPSSGCCRGRNPAEFARHLWNGPGGEPPAGLEVNAPQWYAHGFQAALTELRADRDASLSRPASGSTQPTIACLR